LFEKCRMRFHPLWAAVAGILVIGSIPALVKNTEHRGGEPSQAKEQQRNAAPPATAVNLPPAPRGGYCAPCPCTRQNHFACLTISAVANVRQAVAAERFNRLAIFEIFVGLVTAFVAGLAAWFAKDAVIAARDNLAHDKEMAQWDLRPWVHYVGFEETRADHVVLDGKRIPGPFYRCQLKFGNSGKSPAVQLKLFTAQEVVEADKPCPRFEPQIKDTKRMTLPPNWPENGMACDIGSDAYEAVRAGRKNWWLYGYASYESPKHQGKPYETEFTVRLAVTAIEIAPDGKETPRFTAFIEGEQSRNT
jgi:hypothetical protein